MKATLAMVLGIFAISASAAPHGHADTITLQVTNDQQGSSVNAKVPLDNKEHTFHSLFKNTSLSKSNKVYATSAQITTFPRHFHCDVLYAHGIKAADFTPKNTYIDLDGIDGAAEARVDHYRIKCRR